MESESLRADGPQEDAGRPRMHTVCEAWRGRRWVPENQICPIWGLWKGGTDPSESFASADTLLGACSSVHGPRLTTPLSCVGCVRACPRNYVLSLGLTTSASLRNCNVARPQLSNRPGRPTSLLMPSAAACASVAAVPSSQASPTRL